MTTTALLTLDTLAAYLSARDIQFETTDYPGGFQVLRMGWDFGVGNANIVLSVNNSAGELGLLEISCMTQKDYSAHKLAVVELLNGRNRQRPFSRSMADDGAVWLAYLGFYPSLAEMPQTTFDTLFDSILQTFGDDYRALERLTATA